MGSKAPARCLCLLPLLPLLAFIALDYRHVSSFSSLFFPPPPRPLLPLYLDSSAYDQAARFLEVPQISWGLNNQKIAIARALLTARFLNRSLVLPSLSASLTYKDTSRIQPLPFDRLFSLRKFNSLCRGYVSISAPAEVPPHASTFTVSKGSGRRWTAERDLRQLEECRTGGIQGHVLLKIDGKNPFLWHDHWPAHDYARVFKCFVLVDSIAAEVDLVVAKLKQMTAAVSASRETIEGAGLLKSMPRSGNFVKNSALSGYIAVHMRIEKDWMIHCKKTEERARKQKGMAPNICSSKQEIIERVNTIPYLQKPCIVYLAVADVLLEDHNLLDGWVGGLMPLEKKKLGVMELYKKHSYIVQSAIDYEVCLRADIFVGNSFSTFSSLIVLERTLKMLQEQPSDPCGSVFPSYAYNLRDWGGGPQQWVTNLSDTSLQSISYGTGHVSCP